MKIQGKRISISQLKLEDVYEMENWGFHKNPLMEDYNFPSMNNYEMKMWYKRKTNKKDSKYYNIKNEEDILIGYIGIRNIKIFRKISTLGIVLDSDFIDRGYGTETLITFLKYYFNEMKMNSMVLEVSEFNKRAYRVYEKIGFKTIEHYLGEFFDSNLDLTDSYYLEEKSSFEIRHNKIYTYINKMKLKKKDFIELK